MLLDDFMAEWQNGSGTLLVHTSGSTGSPKPLWVEKRRMLHSARVTCDFLDLHPGDTALLCMPLDYIAGKMMVVRAIERRLRLVSVPPSGHPLGEASLRQAQLMDCAQMSACRQQSGEELPMLKFAAMVPLQVYNSLQVPEECMRLRQIEHLIIGGGAIGDELSHVLRSFPHHVWSTYGMTETLSHIALRRLNGPEASAYYTPFDGVSIGKSTDDCLIIDAPQVCCSPVVTNDRVELKRIVADGKQQTLFRVLGRKDNVICSGGVKIQIEEVEQLLQHHVPYPLAITSCPDEKFGEAVVLLTEASDLASVSDICRQVLPAFWRPKHYHHVACLPLTETGKIARHEARAIACSVLSTTPKVLGSKKKLLASRGFFTGL